MHSRKDDVCGERKKQQLQRQQRQQYQQTRKARFVFLFLLDGLGKNSNSPSDCAWLLCAQDVYFFFPCQTYGRQEDAKVPSCTEIVCNGWELGLVICHIFSLFYDMALFDSFCMSCLLLCCLYLLDACRRRMFV